jgi:hypothetical protein
LKKLMFGIWRIDICRSALSVRCYFFLLAGVVDRCMFFVCGWARWVCHGCLFGLVLLVALTLIFLCRDVLCCSLWFFFASRVSLHFLRPLIYLVCFKTKGYTTARRISWQLTQRYEDCSMIWRLLDDTRISPTM